MIKNKTDSERLAIGGVVTALLASSVTGASLNIIVSLLLSAAEQHFAAIFTLNLSATLVAALSIHLFIYFVLWTLARLGSAAPRRVNLAITVSISWAVCLFAPILTHSSQHGRNLILPLSILTILATSGIAAAAYFAAAYWSPPSWLRDRRFQLAIGAPLFMLATLFLVWAYLAKIDVRSPSTGLPTAAAWMALICYLGTALFIWLISRTTRRVSTARNMLGALTLLILAVPIVLLLADSRTKRHGNEKPIGSAIRQVVLISVDTLRADAVGALNPTSTLSPRIDQLASDSVVFSNARSPSPWTKPSMASILTGLAPLIHGALTPASSLAEGISTIAEILADEGYSTAAIGRNSNISQAFNFEQGFQSFQVYLGSAVVSNPSLGTRLLQRVGLDRTRPSTTRLAAESSSWLRSNANRPFFLWVHLFDPHAPFAPPERFLPDQPSESRIGRSFDRAAEVRQGVEVLTEIDQARVKDLYDAEVRYVDTEVGSLLDVLRELGLYDRALIVFVSDHGEEFFEHDSIGHGHTLYDEVIRVPLMVKLPDSEPAGVIEASVTTESVTPTIVDLTNADFELGRFSAPSLSSYWESTAAGEVSPEPTISSGLLFYEQRMCVVFDQWKYIRFMDSGKEKLFDLEADPSETESLVLTQTEALSRGRELLDEYLARIGSEWSEFSGDDQSVPKEVLEDLRALGYLQ